MRGFAQLLFFFLLISFIALAAATEVMPPPDDIVTDMERVPLVSNIAAVLGVIFVLYLLWNAVQAFRSGAMEEWALVLFYRKKPSEFKAIGFEKASEHYFGAFFIAFLSALLFNFSMAFYGYAYQAPLMSLFLRTVIEIIKEITWPFIGGLIVYVTAYLLGGRTNIKRHLEYWLRVAAPIVGFAVPFTLFLLTLIVIGEALAQTDIIALVGGILGIILGIVIFFYSIFLNIKAVQAAHQFSFWRALGAVVLVLVPIVLLIILFLILLVAISA